ncbi:hypothetical protein, partial [Longispora fulva]
MSSPRQHPGPADALLVEVRRLRQAGLSDLTARPGRYPHLVAELKHRAGPAPRAKAERFGYFGDAFAGVVADLPEDVRGVAQVLFHAGRPGSLPPLDDRRRAADRLYTGQNYSRSPDCPPATRMRPQLVPGERGGARDCSTNGNDYVILNGLVGADSVADLLVGGSVVAASGGGAGVCRARASDRPSSVLDWSCAYLLGY